MKRLVLIFGVIAGGIAAVISIIDFVMRTSPDYPFSFGFGLLWNLPAGELAKALGVEISPSRSLWALMEIGLNTVLFFAVGALFGCVLYRARHPVINNHLQK